jgi:hypothetical protein
MQNCVQCRICASAMYRCSLKRCYKERTKPHIRVFSGTLKGCSSRSLVLILPFVENCPFILSNGHYATLCTQLRNPGRDISVWQTCAFHHLVLGQPSSWSFSNAVVDNSSNPWNVSWEPYLRSERSSLTCFFDFTELVCAGGLLHIVVCRGLA